MHIYSNIVNSDDNYNNNDNTYLIYNQWFNNTINTHNNWGFNLNDGINIFSNLYKNDNNYSNDINYKNNNLFHKVKPLYSKMELF